MTDEQKRTIELARSSANVAAENAGFDGRHDDGGASRLREIVNAWEAGLAGRVPESLREFALRASRELDPEWSEYNRLARKFGDKR